MNSGSVKLFTVSQALSVVNCSESTLRRKLRKEGVSVGARMTDNGWRIPVETLETLGLLKTGSLSDNGNLINDDLSKLRSENSELKAQNEVLRTRLSSLEAIINAKEETIAAQLVALRLIESPCRKVDDPHQKRKKSFLYRWVRGSEVVR